jgi:hypothetical protein
VILWFFIVVALYGGSLWVIDRVNKIILLNIFLLLIYDDLYMCLPCVIVMAPCRFDRVIKLILSIFILYKYNMPY